MNSPDFFRDDLPRGQYLVTPIWLARLQQRQAVPAPPVSHWRLFEVGCGAPTAFQASHIPGAGYLDTECLETIPFWNKVDDTLLVNYLLACGIAQDITVVLYGRPGPAAARAAHLMMVAGVQDVRLLDGGLTAWLRAGLPVASGDAHHYLRAPHFGRACSANPQWLVDLAKAKSLSQDSTATLVSIRTWAEFSGQTSGYPYIASPGDIPGARWGRAGVDGDVNSMSDFLKSDGTMKAAHEITAMWREHGIESHRPTVFSCGTGWRASLAFFYAWVMGWEQIAVFDGGWFEWSSVYPPNPDQTSVNGPSVACRTGRISSGLSG
ncbi:sulfurtransferase [Rhodoferax sp. PAMC 29310]|uniref:sulfurtransferase n=1 Tax=Rhodoferax sp. PAMC 29310 TaxID=2822760 RepID=UPI001B31C7CA|nr:rhodanese-like domain-containing protein [Rhodoferax sp. PAMC 29310]